MQLTERNIGTNKKTNTKEQKVSVHPAIKISTKMKKKQTQRNTQE